jgi:hypothetical protein
MPEAMQQLMRAPAYDSIRGVAYAVPFENITIAA